MQFCKNSESKCCSKRCSQHNSDGNVSQNVLKVQRKQRKSLKPHLLSFHQVVPAVILLLLQQIMSLQVPLHLMPSFRSLSTRGWAQVVLREWQRYVLKVKVEGLEAEVARLAPDDDKEESIWTMKKEQLIEVARRELCMTIAQAQTTQVRFLREQIRKQRKMAKMSTDPMAYIPKGLSRMNLAELKEEHEKRGLPWPAKATKVAFEQMITDDCKRRELEERRLLSQWTPETAATLNVTGQDEADWMDVERAEAEAMHPLEGMHRRASEQVADFEEAYQIHTPRTRMRRERESNLRRERASASSSDL